jgi:hypothetical protein
MNAQAMKVYKLISSIREYFTGRIKVMGVTATLKTFIMVSRQFGMPGGANLSNINYEKHMKQLKL